MPQLDRCGCCCCCCCEQSRAFYVCVSQNVGFGAILLIHLNILRARVETVETTHTQKGAPNDERHARRTIANMPSNIQWPGLHIVRKRNRALFALFTLSTPHTWRFEFAGILAINAWIFSTCHYSHAPYCSVRLANILCWARCYPRARTA